MTPESRHTVFGHLQNPLVMLTVEQLDEMLDELGHIVEALSEWGQFGLLAQRPAKHGNGNGNGELLSAPQLAELWNIPETWVREQARLGKLPCFRLGHCMRFRIEEVERFLAERARQAA